LWYQLQNYKEAYALLLLLISNFLRLVGAKVKTTATPKVLHRSRDGIKEREAAVGARS
jgi:hypothetical protein